MGFETIHAARHTHATESFPPRDGIDLVAGPSRKRIRRFGAPTDEAVNLFLDVDGRLFHGVFRISCDAGQSKDTENGLRDNLLIGFYLSFFDKKDLTSGLNWFIPCAMNTNENSFGSNARLKRIQNIVCAARVLIGLAAIFVIGFISVFLAGVVGWINIAPKAVGIPYLSNYPSFGAIPTTVLILVLVRTGLFFTGVFVLNKLFRSFAGGNLFIAGNIRIIKLLGLLVICDWLVVKFLAAIASRTMAIGVDDFAKLAIGLLVILIALIMDEGRKIQEEQELTV